ncbi:MAG: hypothetical protein HQ495_01345 [Alphaproteobacteria bacterium]|nr:hypothetical protein [Alphaproteobacteria bacterium]
MILLNPALSERTATGFDMDAFATMHLPAEYDFMAPNGSDVRKHINATS